MAEYKYGIFERKDRKYSVSRPQYRVALELLREVKDGKVLDLGCGVGEFCDILRDRAYDVTAIDGLEEFVQAVKGRGHKVHKANLEFERLPFADSEFDIVVSLDVIEHLWNTKHYLDEMRRVTRPGGLIVITTTNYDFWRYRLTHMRGRFHEFSYGSRHKKFYNTVSFEREIGQVFQVVRCVGLLLAPLSRVPRLSGDRRTMNLLALTIGVAAVNSSQPTEGRSKLSM